MLWLDSYVACEPLDEPARERFRFRNLSEEGHRVLIFSASTLCRPAASKLANLEMNKRSIIVAGAIILAASLAGGASKRIQRTRSVSAIALHTASDDIESDYTEAVDTVSATMPAKSIMRKRRRRGDSGNAHDARPAFQLFPYSEFKNSRKIGILASMVSASAS
jgi:hypothetical protein